MISRIVWAYKNPKKYLKDTIYLSSKDINHLDRIYHKYDIKPDSIDEVVIEFLLERHNLARYLIKELDIVLKIHGNFIIKATYTGYHANYIRSKSQIKYEFSVSTKGRYSCFFQDIKKNKLTLKYEKNKQVLHTDDSIDKWSFGIITNGKKNNQVQSLVQSIIGQNIPNYEIIICGDYQCKGAAHPSIVKIKDVILSNDIRAPITIKKNNIVDVAKFQNLMLMHDRYILPNDWFANMREYGNYFDLITMPNIGTSGGRVNDWGDHLGHPSQIYSEVFHLLPYQKWSSGWYSQGGLLIIKKHLYLENMLDNNLFWDELEDIQFSQIGNLMGWFYYLDVNNKVYTFSDRLNESKNLPLYLIPIRHVKSYLNFIVVKCRNMALHFIHRFL